MKQKIILQIIIISIILLTSTQITLSQPYYADIELKINERGETTIKGITNHPELIGIKQDLIRKENGIWTFNLTKGNFSDAIFKIILPKDTTINYIRSTARISIGSQEDKTFVKGILSNKPLELILQYQFEEQDEEKFNITKTTFFILSIILIIIGTYLLFFKNKKREEYKNLTQRQKMIMRLIEKNKDVNQKFIEQKINLPKSSVSRNLAALERKNLITRKRKGFSNIININDNQFR